MPETIPPRVLVVDDDQITIVRVTRLLESEGYRVDAASDGNEAIAKLRDAEYAVVLLDLLMPSLDGFGVLQFMSAERPDLRARTIIVTAMPDESTADPKLAGTFGVMRKPIDNARLPACVRECATQPARRWGT
ncbi:MAG: response regulator [Thermoanaerobaculia bacterium]